MKVKTVENLFKVALGIIAVFAIYLIIVGTGRILHGEVNPLKGSLRELYDNYLQLIVLVGFGIGAGVTFLILTGTKPK